MAKQNCYRFQEKSGNIYAVFTSLSTDSPVSHKLRNYYLHWRTDFDYCSTDCDSNYESETSDQKSFDTLDTTGIKTKTKVYKQSTAVPVTLQFPSRPLTHVYQLRLNNAQNVAHRQVWVRQIRDTLPIYKLQLREKKTQQLRNLSENWWSPSFDKDTTTVSLDHIRKFFKLIMTVTKFPYKRWDNLNQD